MLDNILLCVFAWLSIGWLCGLYLKWRINYYKHSMSPLTYYSVFKGGLFGLFFLLAILIIILPDHHSNIRLIHIYTVKRQSKILFKIGGVDSDAIILELSSRQQNRLFAVIYYENNRLKIYRSSAPSYYSSLYTKETEIIVKLSWFSPNFYPWTKRRIKTLMQQNMA